MNEPDAERALVRFVTVLATLSDHESLTARLCEASRKMLEGNGVSMTLNYLSDSRLSVYVSGQLAAALEDLQDVVGEGPSFDAARTGEVVTGRFEPDSDGQWGLLRERLVELDFAGAMVAIPLHADDVGVGVMTVYRDVPDLHEDTAAAGFLGATVGTALLEHTDAGFTNAMFSDAWHSRAEVHQATGMIVAQVGIRPEDAMALLRGQAFARGVSLSDVAHDIVSRRINFRQFTIEGD